MRGMTPLGPIIAAKLMGGNGQGASVTPASVLAAMEGMDSSQQSDARAAIGATDAATSIPDDVKQALLDCFSEVSWVDEDQGEAAYNNLVAALYPVQSISAVYTQSGTVYPTDSLDSLKTDLVVTATYQDSSTQTVPAANYTLSGTLEVGTSTITVSYFGKTTTFTVTVSSVPILPAGYKQVEYLSMNGSSYFSVTPIPSATACKITSVAMQTQADSGATHHATGGGTLNYYVGTLNFFNDGAVGGSYGTNRAKTTWDSPAVNKKVTCVYTKPASGDYSVDVTIDGATKSATAAQPESNKYIDPVRVGWLGIASGAFVGRVYEMYGVDSSDNSELFHFYPCVRESDSVAGMYDLVNEAFHASDTATPFTAGPEV